MELRKAVAVARVQDRLREGWDVEDALVAHRVEAALKRYVDNLEPWVFKRRIKRFWEHDFARMSHPQISQAIDDVLTIDGEYAFPVSRESIAPGTQLLRVRHVPRDFVPTHADCRAPPKEKAGGGRLDKEGEPWLYTSFDLGGVFSEMPTPPEKMAMVVVYKVRHELQCSCPVFDTSGLGLTARDRRRLDLVTQFLRDLFSLEVEEGQEHLYKITQVFAASLVNYPECVAVWYPSVKSPGWHVAVQEAHQDRLQLTAVKMMDSVVVRHSTDTKKWEVGFRLLRSYDGGLVENTSAR